MARNARTVGERIEELLAGLGAGRDRDTAEELVRLLVEMYGEALTRVVGLLRERDVALIDRLAEDDLLAGLLLLHDLHPQDTDTRVQRALDRVRPYLGSHAGGVEYLGVNDEGVARLRLQGSCDGCPSSLVTVQTAIEGAIRDAAPEIVDVEVIGVTEKKDTGPLLQIGIGPPAGWTAGDGNGVGAKQTLIASAEWATLPEIGPPTGRPVRVVVEDLPVLLCSVRGTLYAYRDACAVCGSTLAEATVSDSALTCAGCASRFDIRLAGRGLDGTTQHLEPLPLISDSHGNRVAVPTVVAS